MTAQKSIISLYQDLAAQHHWHLDSQQERLALTLQEFIDHPPSKKHLWTFKKQGKGRGLYLYGPVGRGKTMLMNLAYTCVETNRKARWHFTEFMSYIHQKLQELSGSGGKQPIDRVINALIREYDLIVLDEVQVTEIADAMILSRLFSGLTEKGMASILSSNLPPEKLYERGLHRDRFQPFVDFLNAHFTIYYLDNPNHEDYRFNASSPLTLRPLEEIFQHLTHHESPKQTTLVIHQRTIILPKTTPTTLWIDFKDICEKTYGSDEYQAIAHHFKIVFLTHIPILTDQNRDAGRRFMVLIDCLYDQNVTLFFETVVELKNLYQDKTANRLPFERTLSRLVEMRQKSTGGQEWKATPEEHKKS